MIKYDPRGESPLMPHPPFDSGMRCAGSENMLQVQEKITDALFIHGGQSEDMSCFKRRRVQSRREGRCRGIWDARAGMQDRVCRARCHEVMETRRG